MKYIDRIFAIGNCSITAMVLSLLVINTQIEILKPSKEKFSGRSNILNNRFTSAKTYSTILKIFVNGKKCPDYFSFACKY